MPSRKGWGIPGGQANKNELIHTASEREVFEETGIKSEFIEILGLREIDNFRFEASEIYFLSLLKAKSDKIDIDPDEILEGKWATKVVFITFFS